MLLFAISIFLSAFLLFQIQPMIGKFILPWFGGTPAVWSTVMLFFQVLLTGGYAYACWLMGRVRSQKQAIIHIKLITFAIALLVFLSFIWTSPITPDSSWKPADVRASILDILKLLTVSIGLPYFILASNGPLMQAWFSRIFSDRSYARLYALSNLGSLLGLLAYPVLIESNLSLRWQGWMWAIAFILFGFLAGWVAARSGSTPPRAQPVIVPTKSTDRPSFALMSLWIALSATASLFLLSVTNQISQEVAVIPSDSKADIEIILGDARISLERELAEGGPQNFDVLVLDTFSSDSIPVHLVTKEAFALYLEHLALDGIIAAHITNLHLDLQPVFWKLAKYYGLSMVRVDYPGDSNGGYASHWVLLSRDPALLEILANQERTVDLTNYSTIIKLWTDDYSNLFQILK